MQVPSHQCGWPEEFRLSLSPDGKQLAYASGISSGDDESNIIRIYTIPVKGGKPKELTGPWTQEPAYSPDGTKIAYIKKYPEKGVWVIPSAGGIPVQVSNLSGRGPIWSQDGKMIAFHVRSIGGNPKEIWIVPVTEKGSPSAAPKKIDLPLDAFHAVAGWTPDNKIGLQLMNPFYETIYTVPSSGGIATQVTPQGYTSYPKWSPDGGKIFFRWDGGMIASIPSGGGTIDTISIQSEFGIYTALPGSGNDISLDGKTIVFSGTKHFYEDPEKSWEVDIFTIPVEGGKPKQLTSGDLQDRFPCWSPDGNSIAFIRSQVNDNKPTFHIYLVSKEGEHLRKITDESDKVYWAPIDWAPDGKSIAYFSDDNKIKSIPYNGGESRIITEVSEVDRHFELAWSPDGEQLAYTDKGKIWVIHKEGGMPTEVKTTVNAQATMLGWSPDCKKIAFTAEAGGEHELWMMEDFLPLDKLATKEMPVKNSGPKEMTIRKVWDGSDVNSDGEPSPDGKYLSFTEYKTSGDLAIREIMTGTKRRLTREGDWSNIEFAGSSIWSPDGKKLAYAWSIGNGNELRITGLDGSEPRTLYKNKEVNCIPEDWTPDGKNILATFVRNNKIYQIGLISVADGSVRILKILDRPHFPHASVSPGGHTIVYDLPPKEDSAKRDIFLISIDGKRENTLVDHSADDRLLDWTPDGKSILFVSDRTGTYDMWRIRVADGNPKGDPELIKKDIGQIRPMGFTQQGSFYYSSETNMMDVFTAMLDLEKGAILSPPKEITQRFIGSNYTPDWSPDGEYLAYISMRKTEQSGPNTCVLCIRSEQTGEVRELYPQIKGSWILRWSPDGRSIFIAAGPKKGRQGLYMIDLQHGDITPVAQSEPGSIIKDFTFSLNGKSVFYVYYQWRKKIVSILRHDLETGQEKEVYRKDTPPDIGGVLVSPDGQYLSFGTFESENNHVINIIPIAGGEPRDLLRMKSKYPGQSAQYAWTPNGKEIFFVKQVSSMNKKAWELWRIPVQGGESQKIGLSKKRILLPRFHPDGKRITFMTFKSISEIWVMENFLPEGKE